MSRISWKDSDSLLVEFSLGPMIETSHLLGPTGRNSSLIKIMVSSIGRTGKKIGVSDQEILTRNASNTNTVSRIYSHNKNEI